MIKDFKTETIFKLSVTLISILFFVFLLVSEIGIDAIALFSSIILMLFIFYFITQIIYYLTYRNGIVLLGDTVQFPIYGGSMTLQKSRIKSVLIRRNRLGMILDFVHIEITLDIAEKLRFKIPDRILKDARDVLVFEDSLYQ